MPGWGGTQLLPNLIGAEKAVRVIIENALNQNRMLNAAGRPPTTASPTSLLDSADFLAESLRWAARVLAGCDAGEPARDRPRAPAGTPPWPRAAPRWTPGCTAPPRRPTAPWTCSELARTAGFADGTAAEDEALADLIMSDELRSGLYAFDLVQQAGQAAGRRPGQVAGPPGRPRSAWSAPG